jgi:N4-(beta-N-acetylglucosaminyl)-L-asparaginase
LTASAQAGKTKHFLQLVEPPVPDALSRREFVASAAVGLAASAAVDIPHPMRPPRPLPPTSRWAAKPVVISSGNGLRAVQKAFDMIMQGADTLDAVIEGVKIQELDPKDNSVGYGGLPNADGVVQLDASCMHGPTRRAGAVGCLEGIKTPSEVAKLILKYTNHIFLVGEGAKKFALSYGFKDEDLLTPESRELWLHWRANQNPTDNYLDVPQNESVVVHPPTGTINCDAVTPQGDLSSITTTSGLAWKIPGRVGDSPIVGAGEYCDNDAGAAGSTGRGESNIMVCGGFLTVEQMRRGMKPADACLETLRRVVTLSDKRLLTPDGKPRFQLNFYAINKRGEYGAASLYPSRFAIHDGTEAKLTDTAHLYDSPAPND